MNAKLRVTPNIAIPEAEFEEHFILSSGAGGMNVNKVASAVQLRFDVLHSPSLPDAVHKPPEVVRGKLLLGLRGNDVGTVILGIMQMNQRFVRPLVP